MHVAIPAAPAAWPTVASRAAVHLAAATRIIVCNGKLCSAQPAGRASAQDLLTALQENKHDLPCAFEESGCLSACGVGAMCTIDFDDGTCAVTAGADELFSSIGMDSTAFTGVVVPTNVVASVDESSDSDVEPEEEVYNDGLDALERMRASRVQQEPAWATLLNTAFSFVGQAKERLS